MMIGRADVEDAIEALHLDTGAYPGGIAALARAIGRPSRSLERRLAGVASGEDLTDREADAIAALVREATGRRGYIETKCANHGGTFIPLPEDLEEGVAEDAITAALLDTAQLARLLARARGKALSVEAILSLRGVASCVIESLYRLTADIDAGRIKPRDELAPVVPLRRTSG